MSKESIYFHKTIETVENYLKLIGLNFNQNNNEKRWFYIYNFLHHNFDVTGEIIWLVTHMSSGIDIIEVTYIIPCLSLSLLGDAKTILFFYNMDHVKELIMILKKSFATKKDTAHCSLWKEFRNIDIIFKVLLFLNASGAGGFAIGPWVIFASKYYSTGEVKLVLPFLVSYPFDYTDIRFYPFAYLHQLWSAWVAAFSVFSVDSFYYACCASLTVQLKALKYDIENIANAEWNHSNEFDETFKAEFLKIIHRHRQLIRCVDLLDKISSMSNLINVVISSFLICATGFNILEIDNIPLMLPFISFLALSFVQIFILCSCGDWIMRSSMDLCNAIYNCQWYRTKSRVMKDFLFILMRCQKPCKLTAYGFTDINLRAFTKILSTAWSYFAVLTTMSKK